MKRRAVHRIFNTAPREQCPRGDQWLSVVRMWAISRGLNPDRLREPPGEPPWFWTDPQPAEEPDDMALLWHDAIALLLAQAQRQPPTRDELARVRTLAAGDAAKRIIRERDSTLPWETAPPLASRQRTFFDDDAHELGPGAYGQLASREKTKTPHSRSGRDLE